MRIFLIGFMGSGKSHWGKLLAENFRVPFFDVDHVITDAEKKTITQIFVELGEEYFRFKEKDVLRALVEDHKDFVISCGGGTPCFFNNIDFMKEKGIVVWLNTGVDVLVKRLLKEKAQRPIIKTISDDDLKSFILKKLQDRKLYYEQANITLQEESLTIESSIELLNNE